MDVEENQTQVSLNAHSPWKSLRDSHIPTVATKHWKWKTKNRFSHFPLPRVGSSDQIQKGGLAAELRSSSRLIVRLENAEALWAMGHGGHSLMGRDPWTS